ncbi:hypothetical protein ACIA8I_41440 [Streptomyces rishiriensis]|uniref:hypothetical protein n=1 Tax=Streptomyces rishiriensis TaxID=68264 RepID=UPI0037A3D772
MNEYAGSRRLSLEAPAAPWAMYLAGADRRYRFLAFDLDAKGGRTPAQADADARALAMVLHAAGLPPVVCGSGPSGGRHVWVALAESVDAATVATLARLLKHEYPTLDISPLTNPATGCVRPPGSPHRHGGASVVLAGLLDWLTYPTATADQVRTLVEELASRIEHTEPERAAGGPLPVDANGRLYLPGSRRALPPASQTALAEDAAAGDASSVLWRVLIGAAAAHWRYADVAELVGTAAGLEHVRTLSHGGLRVPRSADEATAVLRRQWDKAVRWVSSTARQVGSDPTFDPRAGALAAHVRTLQERADASAGRWSTGAGPADRRVLDALCMLSLEAMSARIEIDVRRLAEHTGMSHQTASVALHRLARDGWILRTQTSQGARAAFWSIDPHDVLHRDQESDLTQADPRPLGAGAAERTTLHAALAARTEAARHDAFTPGPGLGLLAGNTYARLSTEPQSCAALARRLGMSPAQTGELLNLLRVEGLAQHSRDGWSRPARDRRGAVAALRGVSGRLATRVKKHRLQRAVWAWWLAETTWMTAPRPPEASAAATAGPRPVQGLNTRGRYPRHLSGRADHHTARQVLVAGTTAIGAPRTRDAAVPVAA